MNADYWPKYLFKARLIPLSKDDKAFTSLDKVRTISVIPPTAKLIERIILNRIQEQLYNSDSGLISPDQLGFRPGASCQDQIARFIKFMDKAVDRERVRRAAKIQPADHQKTFVCCIDLK